MITIISEIGEHLVFFEQYCKSRLNLVKTHTFNHFVPAIVLFEDPSSLSTEVGEHGHKTLTKDPWRGSNHKSEESQMTKKVRKSLACELVSQPSQTKKRSLE